jgi:hypothetical protein
MIGRRIGTTIARMSRVSADAVWKRAKAERCLPDSSTRPGSGAMRSSAGEHALAVKFQ